MMAFVKRDVWTPSLRTLWLLCAVAAGDILETWIQPLAREAFFNEAPGSHWPCTSPHLQRYCSYE